MADEIRVTNTGTRVNPEGTHTHADEIRTHANVEATIEPDTSTTGPTNFNDTQMARGAIESTRARMSETIDEIEDVLVRKKEKIRAKLDVTAPIREHALPSVGIAFGIGALLGLVTGGDDEVSVSHRTTRSERAEDLEERTRRLLDIAQRQEREIETLRAQLSAERRDTVLAASGTSAYTPPIDTAYSSPTTHHETEKTGRVHHAVEGVKSTVADVRDELMTGLSKFVSDAVDDFTSAMRR